MSFHVHLVVILFLHVPTLEQGPSLPMLTWWCCTWAFGTKWTSRVDCSLRRMGASAPSVLCKPWEWLHMCWGRRVIICETFTSCLGERVWEANETLGGHGSWKAIVWYPTLNAKCSIQRSAASPIRRTTKKGKRWMALKGRQRWMALIVSWL